MAVDFSEDRILILDGALLALGAVLSVWLTHTTPVLVLAVDPRPGFLPPVLFSAA